MLIFLLWLLLISPFPEAYISHPSLFPKSLRIQNKNVKQSIFRSFSIKLKEESVTKSEEKNSQKVTMKNSYNPPKARPRTGILQYLLNIALESRFWKVVLVPMARQNIRDTAEANAIPWTKCRAWIENLQDVPWNSNNATDFQNTSALPNYYRKPFHAYEDGNLCWDSAFEQEIASRAVGARNFPAFGEDGEDAFRNSFLVALDSIGAASVSSTQVSTIVDLGCGTGTSTRILADLYPNATSIIGIDLSPYFIVVGKKLLNIAPTCYKNGGHWVRTITKDERIELRVGDAAQTNIPSNSVDIVSLNLVIHELPIEITKQIITEAYRILNKSNGQLWITEMDFESPPFEKQRSNPLLFSLIRATEPYLDIYANGWREILQCMSDTFAFVNITAATGRHYAMIGFTNHSEFHIKKQDNNILDTRFFLNGTYRMQETHLKVWESKSNTE